MGLKIRGWWKSRKSAPFFPASSNTSSRGVSATRTRLASASALPTWSPQLSQLSERRVGAMRSIASDMSRTRATAMWALYNPPGSEPRPQASRTDLRRYPPPATRRTALSRHRVARRGCTRRLVGPPLPVSDEWSLAHLPRVPRALRQGTRPAQHSSGRAGASFARGCCVTRRGVPDLEPPRRSDSPASRPPLLCARHPTLRPPHAPDEPLAPRRRRLRRGGVRRLCIRGVGAARGPTDTARVVGEDGPRAPHASRTGARRAGRGRCNVGGVPAHRLGRETYENEVLHAETLRFHGEEAGEEGSSG